MYEIYLEAIDRTDLVRFLMMHPDLTSYEVQQAVLAMKSEDFNFNKMEKQLFKFLDVADELDLDVPKSIESCENYLDSVLHRKGGYWRV